MSHLIGMRDPILRQSYDFPISSQKEEHLYKVLEAALGEDCPTSNTDYLCEDPNQVGDEAEICVECFKRWAKQVPGADNEKTKRLEAALELALYDKCPPNTQDFLCQATEDESTDIETCKQCIMRWATLPYGIVRYKK